MTLNLHAREDFAKGDLGCVTGHLVRRATEAGPAGTFMVTALQDVRAGMTGWFAKDTPAAK